MARHEKPLNTTYFPENIVRDAVGGCCHDLAYALHKRTGWPIALLLEYRPGTDGYDDQHLPKHVFCIAPNGQGVDAEGTHRICDMKTLYTDPFRKDRTLSLKVFTDEACLIRFISDIPDANYILPRAHGTAAAEASIRKSPNFLMLIQSLNHVPAGPVPGL